MITPIPIFDCNFVNYISKNTHNTWQRVMSGRKHRKGEGGGKRKNGREKGEERERQYGQ